MNIKQKILGLLTIAAIGLLPTLANAQTKTWTDPNTGLTWAQEGPESTWYEATLYAAKTADIGAHYDWRLPSLNEVLTVFQCREMDDWAAEQPVVTWHPLVRNNSGSGLFRCPKTTAPQGKNYSAERRFIQGFDKTFYRPGIWTTTTAAQAGIKFDAPKDRERAKISRPRIYFSNGIDNLTAAPDFWTRSTGTLMLVRGGTPSPEWAATVKEAGPMHELLLKAEKQERTADDTRYQQAQAAEQKRDIDLHRKRQAETARLRTSPKPGDQAKQGLVIAVKGDLVQMQQPEHQICAVLGTAQTGYGCKRYERVPARVVWLRKLELSAP